MRRLHFIRSLFIFVAFCAFVNLKAQLSTNEKPISFGIDTEMLIKHRNENHIVTMPQLDMAKIEKEDREDDEYDMPPRYGYRHKVNYNLNNSGTWYELPNGDKLWQLNVVCPNALSVNFCYDKFWIPDGGKLFVYSKDRKYTIGAFTSKNNKGDREHLRGFATGLVFGGDVILEYYQPKNIRADAIISIEYVVHGYRYIKIDKNGFDTSGCCMVNINCEEGQNWQNEKKAVAMILVNGERVCTGSLINTTSLNQAPLFLTACHCLNDTLNEDALSNTDLTYYTFYWNYEAPGCLNDSIDPLPCSTSGATLLANNHFVDFALLSLTEDPINISNYIPYYLGWDRSGDSGAPGVGIHHPHGDIKKISTVASEPVTASNTYFWSVSWKSTLNGHGTTEDGSSGSPLLTADHKVIGQLLGGVSSCNNLLGPDKYGKFSVSWIGTKKENDYYRRLDCWLDSLNMGVQALEGLLIIPAIKTMSTDQQLYSNIRITGTGQLTIQGNNEMMGNSRIIVEGGGKLIVDGGTLSSADLILKAGASLRIINGGIIETRKGFKAPVGALINIENGKIL